MTVPPSDGRTGRLGFGIAAALGPGVAGDVAGEVERLGYETIWTTDGTAGTGLPLLAAAQRSSHAMLLGVGVIPCDLRGAREIAETITNLGIDTSRAIVGIGSGRAEHPAEAVRAAVTDLRALLPPGSAIGIAALGPRMCRLAGEIADVVLLNWMTPQRIRWARERIAEGARRGGRKGGPVIASYVRVAIGADASDRLAAEADRYARVPAYGRSFAGMAVEPEWCGGPHLQPMKLPITNSFASAPSRSSDRIT
ncbi:MAG: LLM class flavin-dependent oxidoreductase [Chloroflexi bacterium]|nr:LLM class flavin-dependent oxidoreductase [Chloroflexota bacterium]